MSLTKKAKILTKEEVDLVANYIDNHSRHRLRDLVILYLTVYAGLRAVEISRLNWDCLLDKDRVVGTQLILSNKYTKGGYGGRCIPLHLTLKSILEDYLEWLCSGYDSRTKVSLKDPVVQSERGTRMMSRSIYQLLNSQYKAVGLEGYTSHSGRRTLITNLARTISNNNGSLVDVMELAGHVNINTTRGYVDSNLKAIQESLIDYM